MKKFRNFITEILLFLTLFLAGCQPKGSAKQESDSLKIDSLSNLTSPAEEIQTITQIQPAVARTTFQLPNRIEEFDLIIFPLTQVYAEANEDAEIVLDTETFMPLMIKSKADPSNDLDVCDRFPWYQVEISDDVTGWVQGRDVKLPYRYETFNTSQFEFNEKTYSIHFLVDAGVGPSDEEGLTGCITTITPYFYDDAENTWHFIKAFDDQLNNNPSPSLLMNCYPNYLGFTFSEGGHSEPGTLVTENKFLFWKVNISYQDGGAVAMLRIVLKDDGFELEGFEFEDANSGD